MTFVDFLEALGRACDFKDFPSAKQLKVGLPLGPHGANH